LQRGWQAFGRRDLGSAMKRFNQAWLLNKQNGGVYWAFAIAVMVRDEDFAASEKLFHRALELIPDNPVLIQDLAKTLGMKGEKLRREGEETSAVESFTKSNEYYQKALKVDQIADKAHAGMATNYLNLKNFGLAAHHAGLAIERGQGNEFEIVHIVKCLRRKGLELSDDPGVLPAFKACERWVQSRSRQ
jgi:tetratricopeptide (TPR) repeat protein